jgi:hypothetical protein
MYCFELGQKRLPQAEKRAGSGSAAHFAISTVDGARLLPSLRHVLQHSRSNIQRRPASHHPRSNSAGGSATWSHDIGRWSGIPLWKKARRRKESRPTPIARGDCRAEISSSLSLFFPRGPHEDAARLSLSRPLAAPQPVRASVVPGRLPHR